MGEAAPEGILHLVYPLSAFTGCRLAVMSVFYDASGQPRNGTDWWYMDIGLLFIDLFLTS